MFCNYVNALTNYLNKNTISSAHNLNQIEANILQDFNESIVIGRSLIEKNKALFESSRTYLHFLQKLSKRIIFTKPVEEEENATIPKTTVSGGLFAQTGKDFEIRKLNETIENLKSQISLLTREKENLEQQGTISIENLKSQISLLTREKASLEQGTISIENLKSQISLLTREKENLEKEQENIRNQALQQLNLTQANIIAVMNNNYIEIQNKRLSFESEWVKKFADLRRQETIYYYEFPRFLENYLQEFYNFTNQMLEHPELYLQRREAIFGPTDPINITLRNMLLSSPPPTITLPDDEQQQQPRSITFRRVIDPRIKTRNEDDDNDLPFDGDDDGNKEEWMESTDEITQLRQTVENLKTENAKLNSEYMIQIQNADSKLEECKRQLQETVENLKTENAKLNSEYMIQIQNADFKLEDCKRQLQEAHNKTLSAVNNERERLNRDNQQLQDKLRECQDKLKNLPTTEGNFIQQYNNIVASNQLKEKEAQLEKCIFENNNLQIAYRNLSVEKDRLNSECVKLTDTLTQLQNSDSKMQNEMFDKQSQTDNNNNDESLIKMNQKLQKQLQECNDRLQFLNNKYEISEHILTPIKYQIENQQDYDKLKIEKDKLSVQNSNLNTELDLCRARVKSLQGNLEDNETRTKRQIADLQNENDEFRRKYHNLELDYEQATKKYSTGQKEISESIQKIFKRVCRENRFTNDELALRDIDFRTRELMEERELVLSSINRLLPTECRMLHKAVDEYEIMFRSFKRALRNYIDVNDETTLQDTIQKILIYINSISSSGKKRTNSDLTIDDSDLELTAKRLKGDQNIIITTSSDIIWSFSQVILFKYFKLLFNCTIKKDPPLNSQVLISEIETLLDKMKTEPQQHHSADVLYKLFAMNHLQLTSSVLDEKTMYDPILESEAPENVYRSFERLETKIIDFLKSNNSGGDTTYL